MTDHNPTATLVTYPVRVGLSAAPVLGQAEKWLGNGQREENKENADKHREATMSGHRRIPEAANGPSPAGQPGTTAPGVRFMAPAPVVDAMFDQLEYLATHAVRSCPPGCADCARLTQVKDLLLLPFLSSRHQHQRTPG